MPGALYNYVKYGCGVQAFPVDRDGWSRREESGPISSGPTTRVSITEKITPPSISPPSPKRPSQQGATHVKFKETPENRAPRMRTHAEIKAAKIKREQKKMALSKKSKSRWGLTKGERLVVAQKAVNKKY